MVRKKVTVSLSSRCLQLIDLFAETTGFEARSRVIEEMTFAIGELLVHRKRYRETFQQRTKNSSKDKSWGTSIDLLDLLSRFAGILDRFERFEGSNDA